MGPPGSVTDLGVLGVDGTMLVEHQFVIMRVTRLERHVQHYLDGLVKDNLLISSTLTGGMG